MLSGESQLWVCKNNLSTMYGKKAGEVWRPYLATRPNGRKFNILVWGCLYFNGVWTLCRVEENSEKYIDIFETNLSPVTCLDRHFQDGSYLFQYDNALDLYALTGIKIS